MTAQPGLCRTWSETRTLFFSCRGSNAASNGFQYGFVKVDKNVYDCHLPMWECKYSYNTPLSHSAVYPEPSVSCLKWIKFGNITGFMGISGPPSASVWVRSMIVLPRHNALSNNTANAVFVTKAMVLTGIIPKDSLYT